MIEAIVCNVIRHSKIMSATYGWVGSKPGEIRVNFKLSIPAKMNDKELIKSSNQSILYCGRKNKNICRYYVTLNNVDLPYPNVGNNKFFCEERIYNIIDLINNKVDVLSFFRKERRKIFKELQMELKLEEIGRATREWEALSNGDYYYELSDNYGISRVAPLKVKEEVKF